MNEAQVVAYQWLDTAHYRKRLPFEAVSQQWRPLVLASDYDQFKENAADTIDDLHAEIRQLKAECERLFKAAEAAGDIACDAIAERDQLTRQLEIASDQIWHMCQERSAARKQLDEARELLADAVEWNWLDEDAPSRESVDAWLAANPA